MGNSLTRLLNDRGFRPFRDLSKFENTFERLVTDLLESKNEMALEPAFSPSCDVTEDANHYLMRFDLPGVAKENVKVEINKDRLTVSAERKEEKKHEGKKKHVSEVYYGNYSRSFILPGPVDEKKVDAKFENGVLTLTVPKMTSTEAKQIPVQ